MTTDYNAAEAIIQKTIADSGEIPLQNGTLVIRAHRTKILSELKKLFPDKRELDIQKIFDTAKNNLIDQKIIEQKDPYYQLCKNSDGKNPSPERISQANKILDEKIKTRKTVGNTIPDDSLRMPAEVDIKKAINEIASDLLIDTDVIRQIISSLVAGKHILLTGPVGTGKTHLANILPGFVWKDNKYNGYHCKVVTANSEWTTQDVIGGILPKVDKVNDEVTYKIQDGCVIETIKNNYDETLISRHTSTDENGKEYLGEWLVIDEFNRANIDRAFGPLFTAIQGFSKNVLYPTTDPNKNDEEIKIPEDYRIIGTLNTADKHFLNQLSFALKRRFDIISIEPPTHKQSSTELGIVGKRGLEELKKIFPKEDFNKIAYKDNLKILFQIFSLIRKFKPLGTAFPISMFKSMITHYLLTKDWIQSIDLAFSRQILPQIEDLELAELRVIREFCMGTAAEFYADFDRVKKRNQIPKFAEILGLIIDWRNESTKVEVGKKRRDQIISEIGLGPQGGGSPTGVTVDEPKMWREAFRDGTKFDGLDTTERNFLLNELDFDLNPWHGKDVVLSNFAKEIEKLIDEKSYSEV